MTRSSTLIAIVMFAVLVTTQERPAAQAKGDVELRAAMETETVKGDLNAAIKEYQVVVDRFSKTDRAAANGGVLSETRQLRSAEDLPTAGT